jgi:hypothetical protein
VPPLAVFTPALAAGAAATAVAVPVLVHLLFRKRYQIVPWAAIRFLLVAERRHRRRIDQWLLLCLRALVVLLPLLAMIAATTWAEPLWQAIKPGTIETIANVPRTHHILVIDTSLSMSARTDEGPTRFEKAITLAENLVRSGGVGDGYSVIVLNSVPDVVVPGPATDPEKVAAEVKKLKPSHGSAETTLALGTIADLVARSPRAYPRRQVTFFTDSQRSSWATALPKLDAPAPDAWQRILGRAEVVVVDVAQADRDNLAVASVTLLDPLLLVDRPAVVTATIANLGRSERRDVTVQLLVGRPSSGTEGLVPIPDVQRIEVLPPGGRITLSFGREGQIRFREKGIHVLQVRIIDPTDPDKPVDALPLDDVRSVAVEVRDGLNAILVDGRPDPVPARRGAWYLNRALFPPEARPSDTPARPRVLTPTEFLDPALGDLSGIDCVYLCDVPAPSPELAAKLDAVLKRGGGVVIGLGPKVAADRALYNKVFFNDGTGLLPGPLGEIVTVSNADDPGFRLVAEEEAYRKPPLQFFRDEAVRGGLLLAPFRTYVQLDAPPDGRARRILSFVASMRDKVATNRKPDPALVEWSRHRGRVIVFTSSFNEDWNDWPPLPSYLMFHQELLTYAATNSDRHTLQVDQAIEEFYPPAAAGLTATLHLPNGRSTSVKLDNQDEAGVVRFTDTHLSGLYRLKLDGFPDRSFAVNVPEVNAGSLNESDLKRIDPAEFRSLGELQLVGDPADVQPSADSGAVVITAPRPHGPTIARYTVLVAVLLLATELALAWRWGPARATGIGTASGSIRAADPKWWIRILTTTAALVPLATTVLLLLILVHYEQTGDLLGFFPEPIRQSVESVAGVPAAQPGEGTRWRLEGYTAFVRNAVLDRRIVLVLAGGSLLLTISLYRSERRAVPTLRRLTLPALLRMAAFMLMLMVLLPQLRLAFDREGWPEVAILIDTSASMSHVDDIKDPAVRAKAEELVGAAGLSQAHRLRLAQALLTREDGQWLERLLREKEVKVHIFAVDTTTRPIASLDMASEITDGRNALLKLSPEGDSSRLGEGVEAVLKAFRGGSLAGIIMFTDGITTSGNDLPKAAREASRAGVPLYLIGVGDTWENPDVALTDLQAEDTITVGDRLVFDARLVSRGQIPAEPLPLVLYEKVNGQLVERSRTVVTLNRTGAPVPVTMVHTPTEPGEKTFVLEVPSVPGEADRSNNRLERVVLVSEAKRSRILYVEGYPRYDFRFVKVLLERESERSAGGKGFEVEVVLLDASKGWAETDRSAFRGDFPTRDQLFSYDVVILGDVDPKQLPRSSRTLQDLADFVRLRGGGLLFLSGAHGTPNNFADTPLADILPVIPTDTSASQTTLDEAALTEGYRPRITPIGRQHSLFRFSPDEAEAAAIWNRLQPLYWYAKGYRRKANTVVLAVHPDRPAEGAAAGEAHPLVVQSFAGNGPVLFFGFDDTWRWRWRNDEDHFDRFWIQTIRVLSRSRVRRIELKVSPKTDFRRDEKMTVIVRFPVEVPAPSEGTPVRVTLDRGPLPNADGTPASGPVERTSLTLARVPGPVVQYETTLTRTPDGEYRFTLSNPEPPAGSSPPTAVARVLPPLGEIDRLELNTADLTAAAALSNGRFYSLATAHEVFADLTNLQRIPLNQPCPPIELWNQPLVYLLILLLLGSEWLLRKRERLL